VSAGRVGAPHGLDGSFYVELPEHPLELGTEVTLRGRRRRVERRAGTAARPLLRLSGVGDRGVAAALRGELLLVETELEAGEWLAGDLLGCELEGLGTVRRIIAGATCELLELEDGTLVPFVSDAIRAVDPERRLIRANLRFLGRER
jgi:16S rRNA processing protein RimM